MSNWEGCVFIITLKQTLLLPNLDVSRLDIFDFRPSGWVGMTKVFKSDVWEGAVCHCHYSTLGFHGRGRVFRQGILIRGLAIIVIKLNWPQGYFSPLVEISLSRARPGSIVEECSIFLLLLVNLRQVEITLLP